VGGATRKGVKKEGIVSYKKRLSDERKQKEAKRIREEQKGSNAISEECTQKKAQKRKPHK